MSLMASPFYIFIGTTLKNHCSLVNKRALGFVSFKI